MCFFENCIAFIKKFAKMDRSGTRIESQDTGIGTKPELQAQDSKTNLKKLIQYLPVLHFFQFFVQQNVKSIDITPVCA